MNGSRTDFPSSRRRWLAGLGAGLLVQGLPGTGTTWAGAPPPRPLDPGSPPARPRDPAVLFAELERLSRALRTANLDSLDWRRQTQDLLSRFDPAALRAAIDVDWRALAASCRARGRADLRLEPSATPAGPSAPSFRRKLYLMRPGRAILPHAHRHIVSAFVVLDGRFRGRHYDRVRDRPEAILIRPSDDRELSPGDAAAISDRRDNVHWFSALDDDALLFNVSVTLPERLRLDIGDPGRIYIDPQGEALEGGLIRAPRVSRLALRRRYEQA